MNFVYKWSINLLINPNPVYSHTPSRDNIYTYFIPEEFNAHNRGQAKANKLCLPLKQNQESRNAEASSPSPGTRIMDVGNGGRELSKDILHRKLKEYLHKTHSCTCRSKEISYVSVEGLAILLHSQDAPASMSTPVPGVLFVGFHSRSTAQAQELTFLACIWEVAVPNIGRDTKYSD
jgi:hypothetical protein